MISDAAPMPSPRELFVVADGPNVARNGRHIGGRERDAAHRGHSSRMLFRLGHAVLDGLGQGCEAAVAPQPFASVERRTDRRSDAVCTVTARTRRVGNLAVEVFWGFSRSVINISLFFYFLQRQSVPLALANFAILIVFVFLSGFLSRRMVPIVNALNKQRAAMGARYFTRP